jgi:hypothetical protein
MKCLQYLIESGDFPQLRGRGYCDEKQQPEDRSGSSHREDYSGFAGPRNVKERQTVVFALVPQRSLTTPAVGAAM